jgi:molecular chaperone DnaK
MSEKILGIDLGTTNTCFALFEKGQANVIANAEGSRTTPSIVSFLDNGSLAVGETALRRSSADPEKTISSIKRLIGKRFKEIRTKPVYEIKEDQEAVRILINDQAYSPEEISSFILAKVKKDVAEYLGEEVEKAVITVPAYFNDSQRMATKQAAEIAGFEVLRLVNEPTAAALAYGFNSGQEERLLVFDLGGGTFDVSILDIGEGVFEVLATAGDNYLGGDDFDQLLVDYLIDDFKNKHQIDLSIDSSALNRLNEAAEKAKVELSSLETTKISLPFITAIDNNPIHLEVDISRNQLEELAKPLLERLRDPLERAIFDSGLDVKDIDHVILVGGMTRMPAVQNQVEEITGKKPHKNINPDEAVAVGAAIQAGIILGKVEDILLLDVTPLSLGIETRGGVMTKLIDSNSTVPVRTSEIFTTAEDNQHSVEVHILQGDRGMAKNNRSLGRLQLLGIPPAQAGIPQIEVTFDIDTNGILSVRARDLGTNKQTETRIESATGLSDLDIEKMKKEALKFKKADQKEVQLASERVASQIILSRAKYQLTSSSKMNDEEKKEISTDYKELERILKKKSTFKEVEKAKDQLIKSLQKFADRIYQQDELID